MDLLPKIDEVEKVEDLSKEPEIVVIDEDLSKVVDYDAPLDKIFINKPTNGKKVKISGNKKRVVVEKPNIIGGLPEGFAGHEPEEKPVKKKKVLTEKQKAHLDKIRVLAYQKRLDNIEKKKQKKESLEEKKEPEPQPQEEAEMKPDKKTIQEQKYLDRMEARRKKIEQRIIEEELQEELNLKELERQKQENEYFEKFVKNMDKYNYIKKKTQIHEPAQEIPEIINKKNDNPYKDIFNW